VQMGRGKKKAALWKLRKEDGKGESMWEWETNRPREKDHGRGSCFIYQKSTTRVGLKKGHWTQIRKGVQGRYKCKGERNEQF